VLGQSIIIENVAGAAGGLGAQRVKQSEPDGYTLLQAASPHTTNTAVKPQANVDLIRDFVAIRPDRQQRLHPVRQQGERRQGPRRR
jgi:tripartite-type tricarboxylate transporter receptor subunit TctC